MIRVAKQGEAGPKISPYPDAGLRKNSVWNPAGCSGPKNLLRRGRTKLASPPGSFEFLAEGSRLFYLLINRLLLILPPIDFRLLKEPIYQSLLLRLLISTQTEAAVSEINKAMNAAAII